MKKPIFITLEGTEGCGKSTQSKLLLRYLKSQGVDVMQTIEPGGTQLGLKIRNILLHSEMNISPETETMLYMASRAQLVREVVQPALKAKKVVICDRWIDATIAYQGYGLGVDLKWIQAITKEVTDGLKPNLTLFLDLPTKTGLQRVMQRGKKDRIEKRSIQFHNKVRRGYLALAKKNSRFKVIPVTSIDDTHQRIVKEVSCVL